MLNFLPFRRMSHCTKRFWYAFPCIAFALIDLRARATNDGWWVEWRGRLLMMGLHGAGDRGIHKTALYDRRSRCISGLGDERITKSKGGRVVGYKRIKIESVNILVLFSFWLLSLWMFAYWVRLCSSTYWFRGPTQWCTTLELMTGYTARLLERRDGEMARLQIAASQHNLALKNDSLLSIL